MIRNYRPGDARAIAEIFCTAIHGSAREFYTEAQCLAWSPREPDCPYWERRCAGKRPFVFVRNGEIAGFLELDDDGHIDCAYVRPDDQRQGVMSALIRQAIETASARGLERLFVEASIPARGVFEKSGFRLIRENRLKLRGECIRNYSMELRLVTGG